MEQELKDQPKFNFSEIVWVWDLENDHPISGVITDIKKIDLKFSLQATRGKQWLYEILIQGSVKIYLEHRVSREKENCQNPYIYALGEFAYKIKH